MKNKTEIKKSFDKMIGYCEKAHKTRNAVEKDDIKSHVIALHSIDKSSEETYRLLGNFVNPFMYDMTKTGITYSDSVLLLYITLKQIYIIDKNVRGYFREDGRSEQSSKLAEILMKKEGFFEDYGNGWLKNSWILDEEIYMKGIWKGPGSLHKTLMQSLIRGLIDILYKEYNNNSAGLTKYQREFLEKVFWYTKNYDNPDGVALPFI